MADAVERLPFKLARPNPNTGVTDASEIDFEDKPLDQGIGGRDTKVNDNSENIENKVNALISCVQTLIQNVAFISGVPYNIPQQLMTELSLLRIGNSSTTSAICGQAVCGQAICGNS